MKQIKILDIFPDIYDEGLKNEKIDRIELHDKLLEDTNGLVAFDYEFVDKGSVSIENAYDVALVQPYIIRMVKKAEENGYDAVILDCFLDPALEAAREAVRIPVMGACQSACFYAARLAGEFSIVGILDGIERAIKDNIAKYGLNQQLKSIPVIETPVLELHNDINSVIDSIVNAAEKAVTVDRAKAIVFGCTGLSPLVDKVKEKLASIGIDIPIIEPMRAALFDAISCAMMGISHSKTAYYPIINKRRILDWNE